MNRVRPQVSDSRWLWLAILFAGALWLLPSSDLRAQGLAEPTMTWLPTEATAQGSQLAVHWNGTEHGQLGLGWLDTEGRSHPLLTAHGLVQGVNLLDVALPADAAGHLHWTVHAAEGSASGNIELQQLRGASDFAWRSLFHGPGLDRGAGVLTGGAQAMTIWDDGNGPALYVAGGFITVGEHVVNRIARWDGLEWTPLAGPTGAGIWMSGSGNPSVRALFEHDGDLIVAGYFDTAGGVPANNIARWDGNDWAPLGPGLVGSIGINALTVYDGELVAAGWFTHAGELPVQRIARWDGSAWNPLGSGVSGAESNQTPVVQALAVYQGELVVGGNFIDAGGVSVQRIARWNGDTWSALGSGVAQAAQPASTLPSVFSLLVHGGDLIVGGNFRIAGGQSAGAIARWNGSTWQALGQGMDGDGNVRVLTLAVFNGDLYAGGSFGTADGIQVNHLARWTGSAWSPLSGAYGTGASSGIAAMIAYGGRLLVTSQEAPTIGGLVVNSLAGWNGSTWSAFEGDAGGGILGTINASTVYNGELHVAGSFLRAGNEVVLHVARWDGSTWQALDGPGGPGITSVPGSGVTPSASAMTVYNGELIVGGRFLDAGGLAVRHIARWDGDNWAPLGAAGSGIDNAGGLAMVNALTVYEGELIVAGQFDQAGGIAANHIARWNGSSWSALGAGLSSSSTSGAEALLVHGGDLIVGGWFNQAGGQVANAIARWNGSQWSTMGAGFNSGVLALAVHDGQLHAGGGFTSSAGQTMNRVARWTGSAWQALSGPGGNGTNQQVLALQSHGGSLFAGGRFSHAGGRDVQYAARWANDDWHPIVGVHGHGVGGWSTPVVRTFAVVDVDGSGGEELVAAGEFHISGGLANWSVAAMTAGQPVRSLQVSPALSDFGTVAVGATSAPLTVTLTSLGNQPIEVTSIPEPGQGFARRGGNCAAAPFPLAPGATCTLTYTFSPIGVGPASALLSVVTDGNGIGAAFRLHGDAVILTPAQIELAPDTIELSLPGNSAQSVDLAIHNLGEQALDWSFADGRQAGPRSSVTLGHSTSLDIVAGHSRACSLDGDQTSASNAYLRQYIMPAFGITEDFQVTSVMFAIEELDTAIDVEVNLYTLHGGVPAYPNMTLIASTTVPLQPQALSQVDVPIQAVVPAFGTLMLEVKPPNLDGQGRFLIGANSAGEAMPSYLAAPDCGLPQPVPHAVLVQHPNLHTVMRVTGHAVQPLACDLPGDVPWLQVNPQAGTVAPESTGGTIVRLSSDGLADGDYEATLCVASNDPGQAIVELPVSLSVAGDPEPAPARIEVQPTSVSLTIAQGDNDQVGLDLANTGAADLLWSLTQAPASGDARGIIPGFNNTANAAVVWNDGSGPALYVAGTFTQVDGQPMNRIARWDGQQWSPLGEGVNNTVTSLAVFEGQLHAGGTFTQAGGKVVNRIARWDGSEWRDLAGGIPGTSANRVNALTVWQGNLVVGGNFPEIGGQTMNGIARWNGVHWSGFDGGLTNQVFALAVLDDTLIAAGGFTQASGQAVNRIARWNGSQWQDMAGGVGASVQVMGVHAGDLYVGGDFLAAGGQPANRIARWNGSAWSTLGEGLPSQVGAIGSFRGDLYVGGIFSSAGDGVPASRVTRWDGSAWHALGDGVPSRVSALVEFQNELIVAGQFTQAGGQPANRIARWTGADWTPMSAREPLACTLPSWLGVAPSSGTVAGGDSTAVAVSIDAVSLATGAHSAHVCIESNDPLRPVLIVPVQVQVEVAGIGSSTRLIASDGEADDWFARSVAIDGDTAVVSADAADIGGNTNQGAAYVFVRQGDGWVEQAKLVADDPAQFHQFGISVALSGDTALIGGGSTTAAYVFTRSGTTWSQQAKLVGSDTIGSDTYGIAVALDGDTAVVGARQANIAGNMNQGAAYVFVRSGGTWTEQAKLTANDGLAFDLFGDAVAIDGDTIAVGAAFADPDGNDAQGAAYVFHRNGSAWTQEPRLLADDGAPGHRFGGSVAVSGSSVVVGAYQADSNRGRAYVFTRGGSGWTQQARLDPSDLPASAWFGDAVAIDGDVLAVGALFAEDQGATYVYTRDGSSWTERARLVAPQDPSNSQFGNAVSLDGRTALVGAWQTTVDGQLRRGAAYVIELDVEGGGGSALQFTPALLDFGPIPAGIVAGPAMFGLTNTGDSAVSVTSIDAIEAPFEAIGGNCPALPFVLAAQESCTVGIRFVPTQVGSFEQQVFVGSDAGSASLTVRGTGIATIPAQLILIGGSDQSATIGTAFAQPLVVQVRDAHNNPVSGIGVEFTAPDNGASAVLSASMVTTDANGIASVTAVANDQTGAYVVTAAGGPAAPVQFALANTATSADVAVTIQVNREYVRPGQLLDYVVVVHNHGPDAATPVDVASSLSEQLDLAATTWQCLGPVGSGCTAGGVGELVDTGLAIPAGGMVTYVLTAPVHLDGDGVVASSAHAIAPSDPEPGNNSATTTSQVVLFRDGFELYGDGAGLSEPMPVGALNRNGSLRLIWPGASSNGIDTVMRGEHESGSGFRLERLSLSGSTWLRVVLTGAEERAGAWLAVRAGELVALAVLADQADAGRLLLLSPAGEVVLELPSVTGYQVLAPAELILEFDDEE